MLVEFTISFFPFLKLSNTKIRKKKLTHFYRTVPKSFSKSDKKQYLNHRFLAMVYFLKKKARSPIIKGFEQDYHVLLNLTGQQYFYIYLFFSYKVNRVVDLLLDIWFFKSEVLLLVNNLQDKTDG